MGSVAGGERSELGARFSPGVMPVGTKPRGIEFTCYPASMQIVILDGHTTNPGDLTWAPVEALGPTTVHARTPDDLIVGRAAAAEAVLTNKTPLAAATLAALPRLRYVGVLATGVNVVDLAAARARGITITNVPEYSTPNVAQATWALVLELTNQVGRHAAGVRAGRWTACEDFCYWETELVELAGLTLGLVGYGRIARAVAAVGRAFGMQVIAHRRQAGVADDGTPSVPLDELFAASDVVSLHCPLTPETAGLVDARRLALMKPTALLVNTARGGLVVEADLAAALDAGRIAGAGLDVLSAEPPPADNPLLGARNCIITPHVAWATRNARGRLIEVAAANLRAFAAGRPQNVVG
jgi:glycerate dehydrogenase